MDVQSLATVSDVQIGVSIGPEATPQHTDSLTEPTEDVHSRSEIQTSEPMCSQPGSIVIPATNNAQLGPNNDDRANVTQGHDKGQMWAVPCFSEAAGNASSVLVDNNFRHGSSSVPLTIQETKNPIEASACNGGIYHSDTMSTTRHGSVNLSLGNLTDCDTDGEYTSGDDLSSPSSPTSPTSTTEESCKLPTSSSSRRRWPWRRFRRRKKKDHGKLTCTPNLMVQWIICC